MQYYRANAQLPDFTVTDETIEQAFQALVDDYKYVFDTADLWKKLAIFCNAKGSEIYITDESVPD